MEGERTRNLGAGAAHLATLSEEAPSAILPHGLGPKTRLGRYELLAELGHGGMATVWAARLCGDLGFQRIVAAKTILPEFADDAGFRRSLFEEARLAARLRHANVVEVIELLEEHGVLFQVMTLVEGEPLSVLLTALQKDDATQHRRGVPPGIAARILGDALSGLHAAHEITDDHGQSLHLVHRDVSPQNILVGVDGVSRLTDFGIAKAFGRLSTTTEAGQIRGKPGYLAPEQLAHLTVDRRVDVYAAGIVFWEMLSGRRLFRPQKDRPTIARPDPAHFVELDMVPSDVPEAFVAIVKKALNVDPDGRFATAHDMRDAIEAAARDANCLATAKDVGGFVLRLAAGRIEERRERMREALQAIPAAEEPSGDRVAGAPPRGDATLLLPKLAVAPQAEVDAADVWATERKRRTAILAGIAAAIVLLIVVAVRRLLFDVAVIGVKGTQESAETSRATIPDSTAVPGVKNEPLVPPQPVSVTTIDQRPPSEAAKANRKPDAKAEVQPPAGRAQPSRPTPTQEGKESRRKPKPMFSNPYRQP